MAVPGHAKRTTRAREIRQRVGYGVLGVVTVLAAWEMLVANGTFNELLTSRPTAVGETLWELVQQGSTWRHVRVTAEEWAYGFAVAAVVGIAIGLVAGWFRGVRLVVEPWLNVLYAAPELALVPIFILWFGIGMEFKVWLAFTSAVFVIAVNTIAGVRSTEARYLDVARTYGASRLRVFRSVVLPSSVPYIMTGLRQGSGRAIVGVIAAEFLSSNAGLGFFINRSGQFLNTSAVMAGIVLLAVFGIVTGEFFRIVEARFDVWRRTE